MGKTKITEQTELKITGIKGYFEKTVTRFGSGAKIDCPKEYLGKHAYIIILKN